MTAYVYCKNRHLMNSPLSIGIITCQECGISYDVKEKSNDGVRIEYSMKIIKTGE